MPVVTHAHTPSRRVDALQAALASVSGLRVAEQILMCNGRPLEAAQPLSAYQLPQVCGMFML
jgi:hypothetical protein